MSSHRSSTCSHPTLKRKKPGGKCSWPANLPRRSMVLSTPPRLVADLITRTESHTVSAAAAVWTSKPIMAPKPVIWVAALCVAGVIGHAGVPYAGDGWVFGQALSQGGGTALSLVQPEGQSPQAS